MEAVEFGIENDRKIVLIPGNMMSWKQFDKVIPELEKDFHVIAISTDGYDGKSEFATSESSAISLEKYIEEKLDAHNSFSICIGDNSMDMHLVLRHIQGENGHVI